MRDKIVEAAAKLLREQGIRAVTTRAVAEAADVQAPTIYRLFGDKEGLVDAVAEHVLSAYVAAKLQTHVDGDPVADLRAGWHSHIEFGLANPGLFTLIYSSERVAQSPAIAAGIEKLRDRIRALATAGLLRVDEDRALAMVHAAGVGAVLAVLDGAADRSDPGFTDAMFDAVAGSVLSTKPAADDDSLRTVAVTFGTRIPELPGLTDAERMLMSEWLTRSLKAEPPSTGAS
ncbi:TetR/AcrR family transcriptional regulator [Cryptosporangium sp. NPDC048952]|uniref:TetR/AcrR family transcriptional regulator n=1 Tax=Cryptosporangium sp. NPDC048952 TaxID=3363961 RepID=UPI003717F4BF